MKKSITGRQQPEQDPHRAAHLFVLRVWIARDEDRRTRQDLAGKVQDPLSGQVRYFRRATQLVRILHRTIAEKEDGGPTAAADPSQADAPAPDAKN